MRFISSDVKINFIIAYAVGSIFILWNPLGTWNLIFPVIAMLGYLLIGSKGQLFVADEQKGDSFYYLGFLFTLTALMKGLIVIGIKPDQYSEKQLYDFLGQFGVAISTTIVGLAGRIILGQFRLRTDELEQAAETDLAKNVREFKVQLDASMQMYRQFADDLRQANEKTFQEQTEQYTSYLKRSIEDFQNTNQKIIQEVQQSAEVFVNIKDSFTNFNQITQSLTSNLEKMNQDVDSINKTLKEMFTDNQGQPSLIDNMGSGLNKVSDSLQKNSEDIERFQKGMSSSLSTMQQQREDLEKEIEKSKDTIKKTYEAMAYMTKFIVDKIKK